MGNLNKYFVFLSVALVQMPTAYAKLDCHNLPDDATIAQQQNCKNGDSHKEEGDGLISGKLYNKAFNTAAAKTQAAANADDVNKGTLEGIARQQKTLADIGTVSDVASLGAVGAEAYTVVANTESSDVNKQKQIMENLAKLRNTAGKALIGAGIVDVGIGAYGRTALNSQLGGVQNSKAADKVGEAYQENKKASWDNVKKGALKVAAGVLIKKHGKMLQKSADELSSALPVTTASAQTINQSGQSVNTNGGLATTSNTIGINTDGSSAASGSNSGTGSNSVAACTGGGCSVSNPVEAGQALPKAPSQEQVAKASASRSLASISGSVAPVSPDELVGTARGGSAAAGSALGASAAMTEGGGRGASSSYGGSGGRDLASDSIEAPSLIAMGIHPASTGNGTDASSEDMSLFSINTARLEAVNASGRLH